ncbi:outer membrane beta-barrel family protein [Flavobacterium orientale]|uniref:TonB-dependent receptor n=1 Tax=Flavobacterium orientale TaxID=1756020 RepID=A0A917D9G7_9FLAO|nr:outer membrane beta-barrel family protein [Flavobacterium orientale]GGD13805.1 TonB-dependent receptor [Flavobacterium orientale]
MNLRKPYLILFLLFISLYKLQAQDFIVSGKLIDAKGISIESSEILLIQDKRIKGSGLTDLDGNFSISVPKGVYQLRCYYVGVIIYATDFDLNENTDLGNLISFENTNQLSEVEIVAKKRIMETKIDRTVFNVENSIRSIGMDGYELLKGTPGVSIQGNTISMIGKTNVSIMVDDRIITLSGEDLNNYLRSISSENIKSIEVITTPPAKYSADGNSGLLNIRLKKAIDNSWAVTLRSSYLQSTFATFATGIGFTYNKNKVSLFTDFVKQQGSNEITETADTYFTDENWISRTKREDFVDVYRGIFNLDYKLTENAKVGFKYIGLFNKPDIDDVNNTKIYDSNSNNLQTTILTSGFNNSTTKNNSINAFYSQELDSIGKRMTLDVDYFEYHDSQDRIFSSQDYDADNNMGPSYIKANNKSIQDLKNYSAKIDFEVPSKWANFGFGGRVSWVDNTSDISFFDLTSGSPIVDPQQTNIFDYTENTQSIYANFSKTLNEKWQTQIGLRYENTQTIGTTKALDPDLNETNKFNYNQLFPTAYLLYTANENYSISFNYSKRIGRPDFYSLNPYKWYFSPFLIVEGNPFLQPSFTDNFEINQSFKENITFKLYYSNTKNGSFQIPLIELDQNPPITRMFRDNFYDQERVGATLTYLFNKFSWWESSNTLNGYNNTTTFVKTIPSDEINGFNYSVYTNNTFTLNKSKSFFGELNFSYNAPGFNLFNNFTSSHRLDAGLRYSLRDKGWNFVLYGSDLLRSSFVYVSSTINNTPQTRSIYYDDRTIRLSVSYKFGNRKLGVALRESGNEEEKERIR